MSEWSSEKITSTGFDAQLKGERGFEIHFYTDKREAYLAVEKVCRQFIDHKTQTNADRIRSMTDEDLALFLETTTEHGRVSEAEWMTWLKGKAQI